MRKHARDSRPESDAVPLFGTWRNAYLAVAAAFVIDVALFYAFSRYFA
ncbi:MAG: hypothetical protein M3Z22_07415 [Verrucomicrobiota bacterium]|nr:hypothetical protein [Verrucomicrobiota bacterium]